MELFLDLNIKSEANLKIIFQKKQPNERLHRAAAC